MMFELRWHIPERVLFYKPYQKTISDMVQENEALIDAFNSGTAPVHALVDASQLGVPPGGVKGIRDNLTAITHPNSGWAVVWGMKPIARYFGSVISHATKMQLKFVRDMDAGIMFLSQIDPSLTYDEQYTETTDT